MDQSEYYATNQEFENFLATHNLNIESNDNLSRELEIDNKLLLTHIENLHQIIFQEISKKGINNKFLFDLRKEINKFYNK